MKANELRLGNWIARGGNGEHYQTTAMTISDLEDGRIAPTGIPITEEWLLKFGFEGKCRIEISKAPQRWLSWSYGNDFWIENRDEETMHEIENIKYVHQLQNLYFCLCGEELKIAL